MKTTKVSSRTHGLKSAQRAQPLAAGQLRWQCKPSSLGIKTTDEIRPTHEIIGQDRALRALRVGLEMHHNGYNTFVTGLPGTGRTTTIKRLLREFEGKKVELSDYCYVYNFQSSDTPLALVLPAGQGCSLKEEMEAFVNDLAANVPSI